MRFVEGCDFEEFSKYLAKIGQYTAEGELAKLRAFIDSKLFNLIVFRENDEIIGHAIWHETNTEREILETMKTRRYCWGSLGERRISLNFTNSG